MTDVIVGRPPRGRRAVIDSDDEDDVSSQRVKPPRPSAIPRRRSVSRRRSSARFLSLRKQQQNVENVYKQAIQLNAENRINAQNSWNLQLIENMDQVVLQPNNHNDSEGVNFTKASCTLDASVKIYSYRVDDIYLTSYKVLANWHRNKHTEEELDDGGAPRSNALPKSSTSAAGPTLETNLGTLRLVHLFLCSTVFLTLLHSQLESQQIGRGL